MMYYVVDVQLVLDEECYVEVDEQYLEVYVVEVFVEYVVCLFWLLEVEVGEYCEYDGVEDDVVEVCYYEV